MDSNIVESNYKISNLISLASIFLQLLEDVPSVDRCSQSVCRPAHCKWGEVVVNVIILLLIFLLFLRFDVVVKNVICSLSCVGSRPHGFYLWIALS